jgi:biotin-[acetyl-CoA-carboxylase] ligase BirA-like protein
MPVTKDLTAVLIDSPNAWAIETIDSIDSTNVDLGCRYACSRSTPYIILWAEKQTAGRGRLDRKWFSNPGSDITASVLFPSPVPRASVPKLVLPAGMALVNVLRENYDMNASIRWPNDVLVEGCKLAGILCSYLDGPDAVICGIGINVNSQPDDLEFETYTPRTTILNETGNEISRERLLGYWILEFEKLWELALDDNISILQGRFDKMNFYRGRNVRILAGAASDRETGEMEPEIEYSGTAGSINHLGELIIELHDGGEYITKIDDVIIPLDQ